MPSNSAAHDLFWRARLRAVSISRRSISVKSSSRGLIDGAAVGGG